MIFTSRTPLRVSLFGGGTDYPEYFRDNPGAALGFTIDKYIYISALPLTAMVDYRFRLGYSRIETVDHVRDIRHPVVRTVLTDEAAVEPTDYGVQADLPASAGLGSSSAFTVGFQNLVWHMAGRCCTKMELARRAIHVEREMLKERVGVQDQLHASFGGLNRFDFRGDDIAVKPLDLAPDSLDALGRWFVLVYTGIKRHASEVLDEQIKNTSEKKRDGELAAMRDIVDAAEAVIRGTRDPHDIAPALAPLLAESWRLKRLLSSKVSGSEIDDLYDACLAKGGLAGKLCGAGGGGFLLMIVPPERKPAFIEAMGRRRCVDIAIDRVGSTILQAVAQGVGSE